MSLAFAGSFTHSSRPSTNTLIPTRRRPHRAPLAGPGIMHTHSHHPTQSPMPTARTTHPRTTRSTASQDIDHFPEMSGDARPASRPHRPCARAAGCRHGHASGGRLLEGRAPLVTPTSRTSSKHRSCVYSLVLPPTLDENDTRYYLLLFNARSTLSLYPRGGGSEAVVPEDNILIIVVN